MRRGRAGEASMGAQRNSRLAKAANIRSAFATALSLRHDPPRGRGAHEAGCAQCYSARCTHYRRGRHYRRTCGSDARHCRYVVLRSPPAGRRDSQLTVVSHVFRRHALNRLTAFSPKAQGNMRPFAFGHPVRAVFHRPA
jgi:hypothetical protein